MVSLVGLMVAVTRGVPGSVHLPHWLLELFLGPRVGSNPQRAGGSWGWGAAWGGHACMGGHEACSAAEGWPHSPAEPQM